MVRGWEAPGGYAAPRALGRWTGPGVLGGEAFTGRRGWDPRSWMLAVRAETPVQWS